MKIHAFLICLFATFLIVSMARAEESGSPFSSPKKEVTAPEASSVPSNGIVMAIGRTFVGLQREVNRAINDRLMAIKRGEGNGAIWGGLVVAFLYGVFHALGPGHGKTVVIGYFLGRQARPWRGVGMASWIAVSHVVGAVVIVGIAHLILLRSLVSPTNEFFWFRLVSYVAIILIGLMMLREWARGGHVHNHHDGHHHAPDAHDHHGHGCCGPRAGLTDKQAPWEQRFLALAAGFIPCSGAILILLFTMANGLILAGIAMAAAIALGMGMTLAGLGVASILLRHQVALRLPEGGRATRWLALSGPVFVIGIGSILLAAHLAAQVSF
jgi:ABC-type nickel/cobalt efflux system permease component RcnA